MYELKGAASIQRPPMTRYKVRNITPALRESYWDKRYKYIFFPHIEFNKIFPFYDITEA
jgi:hypothetical protein